MFIYSQPCSDESINFQLQVNATDLGVPDPCMASRSANVKITVTRNEFAPVFSENGQYQATINEDLSNNNRVTGVQARDNDQRVCSLYTLLYYVPASVLSQHLFTAFVSVESYSIHVYILILLS